MRRVVSQGWLHASWRPRFTASHLSWTTHPRLQRQAVVKVHGVFPSNHGYSASSPKLQFHRISRRDSAQVVTPFVQVGTSRFSSVSGGADYPFTFEQLREELVRVVAPPAAGIHLPDDRDDADQARSSSMSAVGHEPADERKPLEIEVFRGKQRMTDEVRHDPPDEIVEL